MFVQRFGKGFGSITLAITTAILASGCITDKSDTAVDADDVAVPVDGNNAPTIAATPASSIEVESEYVLDASAADADGDPLTFQIQGLPKWAQFDSQAGVLRGSPGTDDVGETADIVVSVSDGKVEQALKPFRITVNAKKGSTPTVTPGVAAPVISGTPATTASVGVAYSFKATATDSDSSTLTFSVANKPVWASFSTTTGTLSGTPGASHVKTYSNIVVSVSDGKSTASLKAFSIAVAAANRAPSIAGVAQATATVGQTYSFQPTATDADGNTLGYSITNKPAWTTFSTATGALTGTPTTGAIGSYPNITISVSDGKATTALAAFSLTVQAAANGAPSISGTPLASVNAGTAYSFQPKATDPNGDALTFTISGKPSWATFDPDTGKLSGTPAASAVGSYANIVISTSDGKSTASLPGFSINVVQISNGSATLTWNPPTQNTDGTALQNLAGYRIYYGTTQGSMTNQVTVSNAGLTSYVISNLGAGTHYFGITAYTSSGVESAMSNVGSKTVM